MATMTAEEFLIYLNKFEQRVVTRGLQTGRWGRDTVVPIQLSREEREARKEHTLEFVTLFGTRWLCDSGAVIDYHGLLKRSTGFMRRAVTCYQYGMRRIAAKVVRFSEIRLEDVEHFAPDLAGDFEAWKAEVERMRRQRPEDIPPAPGQEDPAHADAVAPRQDAR